MEGRNGCGSNGERNFESTKDSQRYVPPELLGNRLKELQEENGCIAHDADRHFEHRRVKVPVDNRMPKALWLTEIEKQSHAYQRVAEKTGDDCRADKGLEPLYIADMGDNAYGECPGCQRHGRDNIERDP